MSPEPADLIDALVRDKSIDVPRRYPWPLAALALLAAAGLVIWRTLRAGDTRMITTVENSYVSAVVVSRENLSREVTVQAEFRPYQEVDLHSKVAGFLESVRVDIGDRVEAGQVLAVLEIPELKDDLTRAHALEQRSVEEVRRSESAYEDTHQAYKRLAAVNQARPNLIAQQELDTALAKDHQAAAALAVARQQVEIAQAETAKLNTQAHYSNLTAPFAGVVTKRSVDPGALVAAAISSGAPAPLLRVSQLDRLRLVFPVSMSYVLQVQVGTPVQIRVQNREQPLTGRIARMSRKIEAATRTMEVEVDVPNPDLVLIPGMYASVIIQLEHHEQVLALPIQSVARDSTPSVYRIDANQRIEKRLVKLGMETPTQVEILAGLQAGDRVMLGSRGQVKPGQKVEVQLPPAEKE